MLKKRLILLVLLVAVFAILNLDLGLLNTQKRVKKTAILQTSGNLHTHTLCSDGSNSYEEMISAAMKLGFGFVAFTDHRFSGESIYTPAYKPSKSYLESTCKDLYQKCPQEKRLLCVLGQEVTGKKVHILALGINREITFSQEIGDKAFGDKTIRDIVDEIHSQGGLAIAAHPLGLYDTTKEYSFTEGELINSGFDAMECGMINNSFERKNHQYQLSKKYKIPCVFNSDAHATQGLKELYDICDSSIKTFRDLKRAIKENRCHLASSIPVSPKQKVN